MRSWIIGSNPDCDLVVSLPSVSGRHCRLTEDEGGYLVEDLGSTNGTFVNGRWIGSQTRVTPADRVTLGPTAPMPWPDRSEGKTIRIGREPDNDVVIDEPMVSGYHAWVVVDEGRATIEDLGSSNGTFLNSRENRITRASLSPTDTVYLGSFAVAAARLLGEARPAPLPFRGEVMVVGRDEGCDVVIDAPMVSGRHARLSRQDGAIVIEDLGSANGTFVNGRRVLRPTPVHPGDRIGLGSYALQLADAGAVDPAQALVPGEGPAATSWGLAAGVAAVLLVQAPILAILVVMVLGRQAGVTVTAGNWSEIAREVAVVSFAAALAAFWFGGSNAVLGFAAEGSIFGRLRATRVGLATQFAALGVLGLVQCLLFWTIVHAGVGLSGSWLAMLGVLVLTMAVGLALGLAIAAAARSPVVALMLWPPVLVPLALWGGMSPSPSEMSGLVRTLSAVSPLRWGFEGLLVREAAARPTRWNESEAAGPELPHDMAEPFFPVKELRMGGRASALALGALLAALLGMAALFPRSDPTPLPG